ncbi:Nucleoside-diphosphate-sugar epimerase [Duganella sp. CF402]|uniref:NAD-dependent epimerase/dehydratase family protein n=1 Tax=unclassified Duganella TaxID=2636909 RepID=UPI0008D1E647|nr:MULTISPECIES: NAD(P)-dependent oxidoreductase [unclassified Duganella]RZT05405.1 nucleoside-diphosphate-sugar epimerase [Duganella sp. BK701]SEN08839.1 Nucleoside-diphosphate-sugar epimerase [Duganella sp. CF402]
MVRNVVITGGTGFIGAAIVRELLAAGNHVTVLVRQDSDLTRLNGLSAVTIVRYSALHSAETIAALSAAKPDAFIHCAWQGVGGQDRNAAFQVKDNLALTLDAVDLAAAIGCRQWVGLGSQAEYGNQNRRLNEDAALLPTTLYGKAKLAAGIAALALCEARGIQGAWLRVFSTYGPGDAPGWFIPFVTQEFLAGRKPTLTKCEQQWDYLYVADAARAVVAVIDSAASGVFNLGSGSARPLVDYVEAIRSVLASDLTPEYGAVPYRPDQVMHLEADTSKLTTQTGWRPTVDLSAGIAATVAFERNRSGAPAPIL